MKHLLLAAGFILSTISASANEYKPAMQAYLESNVNAWAHSTVLLEAIRAQNTRTSGYDQAEIDRLDLVWRAEVGDSSSKMISGVLESKAASFLTVQMGNSDGVISEIFIMDARGLNVAASDVTSDYWQGDEAKFQKTFGAGPNSVHFGDVEFDESSQTYQGQLSIVIVDPDSNAPIGAVTIGLNAEALL